MRAESILVPIATPEYASLLAGLRLVYNAYFDDKFDEQEGVVLGTFFKSVTSPKQGGAVHEVVRMRQRHSVNPLLTAQTKSQSMLSLVGLKPLQYAVSPEAELVAGICQFWKTRELMLDPMDVIRYSSHDEIPESASRPQSLELAYTSVAYNKTKINDIANRLNVFKTSEDFFRFFLKDLCGHAELISDGNGFTDQFFQEAIVYVRRRPDIWR